MDKFGHLDPIMVSMFKHSTINLCMSEKEVSSNLTLELDISISPIILLFLYIQHNVVPDLKSYLDNIYCGQ